jgi:hypothetical protein
MPSPQIPVQAQKLAVGVGGESRPGTTESAASYFGSAIPGLAAESQPGWSGPLRPAPKSRRGLISGIAVGVVAVAALAVAIPMILESSGSIYQRTHIAMPKTAAGYKQIIEENSNVSADIAKSLPFSGARVGVYTDPSGTPALMLAVARVKTAPADIPGELSKAQRSGYVTDLNGADIDLSGFTQTPPGPLGGQMRCGTLTADAEQMVAACIFVDEGAQGLLMVNNASTVDNALMLRLRAAIEKRS